MDKKMVSWKLMVSLLLSRELKAILSYRHWFRFNTQLERRFRPREHLAIPHHQINVIQLSGREGNGGAQGQREILRTAVSPGMLVLEPPAIHSILETWSRSICDPLLIQQQLDIRRRFAVQRRFLIRRRLAYTTTVCIYDHGLQSHETNSVCRPRAWKEPEPRTYGLA